MSDNNEEKESVHGEGPFIRGEGRVIIQRQEIPEGFRETDWELLGWIKDNIGVEINLDNGHYKFLEALYYGEDIPIKQWTFSRTVRRGGFTAQLTQAEAEAFFSAAKARFTAPRHPRIARSPHVSLFPRVRGAQDQRRVGYLRPLLCPCGGRSRSRFAPRGSEEGGCHE